MDWADTTTPQVGLGGAVLRLSHGKVLGGSSGINAGFSLRGHRANFDRWAADGAAGWDYESLLPYFKRSETAPGRDPGIRGTDGPMIVAPTPRNRVIADDLLAAVQDAGYPVRQDLNGPGQEGAAFQDMNVVDDVRQTVADAYLRPVLGRPNLTVATGVLARRLLFSGGRCTSVEYTAGAETVRARAVAEVILAAGAIGSPHLLMVSGIGPARQLREFGIDVVAEPRRRGEPAGPPVEHRGFRGNRAGASGADVRQDGPVHAQDPYRSVGSRARPAVRLHHGGPAKRHHPSFRRGRVARPAA